MLWSGCRQRVSNLSAVTPAGLSGRRCQGGEQCGGGNGHEPPRKDYLSAHRQPPHQLSAHGMVVSVHVQVNAPHTHTHSAAMHLSFYLPVLRWVWESLSWKPQWPSGSRPGQDQWLSAGCTSSVKLEFFTSQNPLNPSVCAYGDLNKIGFKKNIVLYPRHLTLPKIISFKLKHLFIPLVGQQKNNWQWFNNQLIISVIF